MNGKTEPLRPSPRGRAVAGIPVPVLILGLILAALPGYRTGAAPAPAGSNPGGLRWTTEGRVRQFTGLERVLVRDFTDGVSDKYQFAPADRRERKRWEIGQALTALPDRLAEALKKDGRFKEVLRQGDPDPRTLVVHGVLRRLEGGDPQSRPGSRNPAANPQFEVRLELRASDDTVLATVVGENRAAGPASTPLPPENLEQATQRVLTQLAQLLGRAGRPVRE